MAKKRTTQFGMEIDQPGLKMSASGAMSSTAGGSGKRAQGVKVRGETQKDAPDYDAVYQLGIGLGGGNRSVRTRTEGGPAAIVPLFAAARHQFEKDFKLAADLAGMKPEDFAAAVEKLRDSIAFDEYKAASGKGKA